MRKRFFACLAILLMLPMTLVIFSSCVNYNPNEEANFCQHRDVDDNSLCDKCGESYTDGKDLPAPCQHRDADDNSLCDKCGESYTDGKDVEEHTHEYNKQVVENKYLASAADYENAAIYYYSCICGEKGTETFIYGQPLEVVVGTEGLEYALNEDGESYSVIGIGTASEDKIVIPQTYNGKPVTSIGYNAFSCCTSLTDIVIPEGVISIGNEAFVGCTGLTGVVIPEGVTSIGDGAFAKCLSIMSVSIPDSIETVGSGAFCDYVALNLPWVEFDGESSQYSVGKYIGNSNNPFLVLVEAGNVTSFITPTTTKIICSGAFSCCENLENITLRDGVTSIPEGAFGPSLKRITVAQDNKSYKDIDGNLYTKDGKTLVQYAIGKTDMRFAIPEGVTSIDNWAFSGCKSLTDVVIPDSVISIGSYAFTGCSNLSSVEIGNGVETIGEWAFSGCESLTSIKYRGTEEEWISISKGSQWNYETGFYTITYNYDGE